jgi:uncharacterized protein YjbI with pentapeptide repeats
MISGPRVRKRVVTTRRVVPNWLLWTGLVIGVVALLLWIGYTVLPAYTGFEKKKAWDWIDLLGISSAIALVGWIISRKQRERDETIALEHAQDETLRAYLDQMSDLMIDQQLGRARKDKDALEDHVRRVAQARTIAILLGLDGRHKRRPLKLIYELELINRGENILQLKNAGLDHADFSELTLCKAHLIGADLRVSDLSGADLSESDLTEADLRGADLRRANLSNAILTEANLLPYDERDPERLSPHRLERSDLNHETLSPRTLTWRDSRIIIQKGREHWWPTITELTVTNLRHAVLAHAHLGGARLGGADLFHADLREAILTNANFLRANLKEADLRGANLTGANLKEADLRKANLGVHVRRDERTQQDVEKHTDLSEVNLSKANLHRGDLSGANLRGAYIQAKDGSKQLITNAELAQRTRSLKGAVMPNGQKYEDWLKSRGEDGENSGP